MNNKFKNLYNEINAETNNKLSVVKTDGKGETILYDITDIVNNLPAFIKSVEVAVLSTYCDEDEFDEVDIDQLKRNVDIIHRDMKSVKNGYIAIEESSIRLTTTDGCVIEFSTSEWGSLAFYKP